jgi:hypothetical protein
LAHLPETPIEPTTFGDWSADYYIFKNKHSKYFTSKDAGVNRDRFMQIFGTYKPDKDRYSWSGEVTPKIKKFNRYGQKLTVDENKNIIAIYSYEQDSRENKVGIIPVDMQINNLILAR